MIAVPQTVCSTVHISELCNASVCKQFIYDMIWVKIFNVTELIRETTSISGLKSKCYISVNNTFLLTTFALST